MLEGKKVYLKNCTSFEIGGPALYFGIPQSKEELVELMQFLNQNKYPWYIIGCGTNILASDEGVKGVVIGIYDEYFRNVTVEENKIYAEAGIKLEEVCNIAAKHLLSGMESFYGIPGSIGGAVCMNAGAFDNEMSNIVDEVYAISPDGTEVVLKNSDCDFSYRDSIFQHKGYIITKVAIKLSFGEEQEIKDLMEKNLTARKMKQPLGVPSAGSFFKRPRNNFAGALIEKAMPKGFKVGNAAISEKHCGFIVNNGKAKAKDVYKLMEAIQKKVYTFYGVKLEPEVKLWGKF